MTNEQYDELVKLLNVAIEKLDSIIYKLDRAAEKSISSGAEEINSKVSLD